jgi:hypothetical protein
MGLGDIKTFDELADYLLAGHFLTGHFTGFGKLIDEKILPDVFKADKLDKKYRKSAPYGMSCFDEIDHIVKTEGDGVCLLCLKASRWTIQLTMAVQLNRAFDELVRERGLKKVAFDKIVVGVYYGTSEELTDKYDILRGENRGAVHNVVDLKNHVKVVAGREFWSWLNNGEPSTQEWVMDGVLGGLREGATADGALAKEIRAYKKSFASLFEKHVDAAGKADWHGILKSING